MMKKTHLILLFSLVFSGAVLLGNTPVGAQDNYTLDGFTSGNIEGGLDGQTPIDPCVWAYGDETPDDPDDPLVWKCWPMVRVERIVFSSEGLDDRTAESSTLGVGEGNPYVNIGGRYVFICNPVILRFTGLCL
jgi:hypothetical protein